MRKSQVKLQNAKAGYYFRNGAQFSSVNDREKSNKSAHQPQKLRFTFSAKGNHSSTCRVPLAGGPARRFGGNSSAVRPNNAKRSRKVPLLGVRPFGQGPGFNSVRFGTTIAIVKGCEC